MSTGLFARALLLFCALVPLHADVIYTNFGTGDAWSAGSGLIVTNDGAAWSSVAVAFIPQATYTLASIELVASSLFAGDGATLALFADDNGHPGGTPLELFHLDGLGQFGDAVPVLTLDLSLQPLLQANTVYWVGLNAPVGGMIVWNQNSSGAAGIASTDGAGNWSLSDSPQGAIEIDGVLTPGLPIVSSDPVTAPLVLQTTNTSEPIVVVTQSDDEIPVVVPEPATFVLLSLALLFFRQKRTRLTHQK